MRTATKTTTYSRSIRTRLGEMLLASDGESLTGLYFVGQKHFPAGAGEWRRDEGARLFDRAVEQLASYAAGELRQFDLPIALRGTPFQRGVWTALLGVRYGQTISYSQLAARAGVAAAVRAVGAAVGRNPVSVIIPCHRIVGADGSLTGYAGGLERKRALLEHEGAI